MAAAKHERNQEIVKAWKRGDTEPAIAARHGISAGRVTQIVAAAAMAQWRHNRRATKRQATWNREWKRQDAVNQRRAQREVDKWYAQREKGGS